MAKKYKNLRVSVEVYRFLEDCKYKSRSKSFENLFRNVSGGLWDICEQIEREHNIRLFDEDHEGKEDYFVTNHILNDKECRKIKYCVEEMFENREKESKE